MTRWNRDVAELEPHRITTVVRRAAGNRRARLVGAKGTRRIAAGLAVGLLGVVLTGCIPPAPPLPAGNWRAEMLNDINGIRRSFGVGPVAECLRLDYAAQAHSNNMASGQFVSDSGPDGSLQQRMANVGFNASVLGENVAAGQSTVAQVMWDWSHDQPHLANVVNPSFALVGFGLQSTGAGPYHYYWTQNFASGDGGPC